MSSSKVPDNLHNFKQMSILSDFFLKVSNIKFHGNPPSGSRADTYGETDERMDEQSDNISPEENAFMATE
jgi:hypothetical protein